MEYALKDVFGSPCHKCTRNNSGNDFVLSLCNRTFLFGIRRLTLFYKAKVSGAQAFITTQISERGLYYTYLDDIGTADSSLLLMFDSAGNIVSQSRAVDEKNLAELKSEICQKKIELSLTQGNEKFFGSSVEMPLSRCTVLLLVNKKNIYGEITFMQILSVLGAICILLLSTFFIYVLSAKLNGPVENLAQVMQDVGHGNFSLRAKVEGNDEIGYLLTDLIIC